MQNRRLPHASLRLPILVAGLLVFGCAAPGSGQSATSLAGGEPQVKRITAVITGNPLMLNERFGGAAANVQGLDEVAELLNSPLTTPDEQGLRQPVLVESVPTVENGLWRLFPDGRMETVWKIRSGVFWHDGTPLTSRDLEFTARVEQHRGMPFRRVATWEFVEGLEALDPSTLVVRWKQPFVTADALFGEPLPSHLLASQLDQLDPTAFVALPYFSDELVGTGPFRLRQFVRDSHVTMRAYDQYVLGRPKIDEIEVRFIPDPNTISANVLAGEVQLSIGQALSLEQALQIKDQWRDGRVVSHPIENVVALWPQHLNPSPAVIGEPRFRRALWHAINRQELADSIQSGMAPVAHGILSPQAGEYAATESAVIRYDYDSRTASQLIEGLGYTRSPDGFRDATGQKLTVELRTGGLQVAQKALFPIRDFWQQVGVGVDAVVIPPQQYDDREYRITRPAFELSRQTASVAAVAQYNSLNVPSPDNRWTGSNRIRYQNAEFDELSDRLLATIPWGERIDLLRQILRHMSERALILFQFYDVGPTLIGNRVQQVVKGTSMYNAHLWEVR